jgi:ABC-type lipoprotein release transport system permease subunit
MTFTKLLLRNLLYHWRGNFAVFLGITLGSAVLTGALLVGDSLRGSLKALTLDQLGWVDEAMLPGRFFRAELAKDVMMHSDTRCAGILMLQGSATHETEDAKTTRAGRVTILGIDASFWQSQSAAEDATFWASRDSEVVLNQTLAKALGAKVGDIIALNLQKADIAPRETILGNRKADEVSEAIRVKVRAILPDEGMARFSLKPTPEPVRNAFVPIKLLQKKLDLAGRANVILAAPGALPGEQAIEFLRERSGVRSDHDLPALLTLDDWGLRWRSPQERAEALIRFLDPQNFDDGQLKRLRWSVRISDKEAATAEKKGEKLVVQMKNGTKVYWRSRVPEVLAETANANNGILTRDAAIAFYQAKRNYYLLESKRMILEPAIVKAVESLEASRGDDYAEVSIYLADTITAGKTAVPYSIVAAVDVKHGPPVGPGIALGDDDIAVVDWPGSALRAKADGKVTVTYLTPNEKNHLMPQEVAFTVKRIMPLTGRLDDPDLTPEFPGITDQRDMANWENPPFPYKRSRVKKSDEDYWNRYRTTPKAYISMAKARSLWGSRFGDITSIVVAGPKAKTLPGDLLQALNPSDGGFVFQPVRAQALKASSGATDFGELFLYFSFFLIVSALLLVGLLVRLNIDRRAGEVGLLLATGWSHARVRWLLLAEGALLAIVGGLVGLGGALLYGKLMLQLLAANWPGGDSLNFLRLHAEPISFGIGYGASLIVTLATLFWATRGLAKMSPRSLLSGQTEASGVADTRLGWSRWLVPSCAVGALLLVVIARFVPAGEPQAGCFFGSGALLLTACLAAAWNGLKLGNRASSPQPTLTKLGVRNAGRHAVRSVLTVGLLAAASFLIVAVESFHKGPDQEFAKKTGGSGGFAFYAESNTPIFEDLDDAETRHRHELDQPDLAHVTLYPCRVQAGDDASCLSLYKPLKPRVMGISKTLIDRGGFHFGGSVAKTDADKKNPWLLLEADTDKGIPAIIDANTAQWILKVGLNDVFTVKNENGEDVKLRVVALLHESIFQSEVLVSEANFLKMFQRQEGFSFFLVDAATSDREKLKRIEEQLGSGLDPLGVDLQTTASRLQGYLAVENMYLLTFQALGGLGLLLGAVGLAIVLLRGVWERRAELALLSALGFESSQLAWLVLVENAFLLMLGLAAGTVSALLAVAPHLVGSGAQVLWQRIALLLGLVLGVGLIAAVLATWSTLRTPVLTALRRE